MARFNASGLRDAPVRSVLDEGLYFSTITKCEGTVSKTKGTPGVHWEFKVMSGPVQANNSNPANKLIFEDLWIPEAAGTGRDTALSKFKQRCVTAEIDAEDDLELNNFINKNVIVEIYHEDYQGEPQARVKTWHKA